ncbi:MAG TPA: hypothetical protein VHB47_26900, partial [Thermoanaerobaculia bacterium]|nr:hypothetical protein [Thermoanaerobaculia bacterium]
DFAYMAPLIMSPEIDWERIVHVANKYQLEPALFYFLSFLERVVGPQAPIEALKELSPLRRKQYRDWGWQLGTLFDFVEPLPLAFPQARKVKVRRRVPR